MQPNAGCVPQLLYHYGEAFLQEASTYYYVNAANPSKLLMETVGEAGVRVSEAAVAICPGALPLSANAGRRAVDAMCANINSPVAAARLFSDGDHINPLSRLDDTERVLAVVESFLDLLATDLSSR